MFVSGVWDAQGVTHYVDANSSNPMPPYTSWATAAATIQDAVDASAADDQVMVTNGVYATGGHAVYEGQITNRIAVTKPLSVFSVNGAQATIIDGRGETRCAYLTNGANLSGFALTNGVGTYPAGGGAYISAGGGGVYCESTNALVFNCLIVSNTAIEGGGAFSGTLSNCTLIGNSAPNWIDYGGGARWSILNHCTLIGNYAYANGGGADHCTLNNCMLRGNLASQGGPGLLRGPLPFTSYGNGGGASSSTLNNCALLQNNAAWAGGAVIECYLTNCTLVANNAGCAWSSTLYNCITYFNPDGNYIGSTLNYCCTTPDPGGVGNITLDPILVDVAGGDLRLQSNSPCINAGNNSYVGTSTDLDGNPRINNGTVDMGAYEFQGASGLIGFHEWLGQYGLPGDGSADLIDSDRDGMNNWQEWQAGTNPTNAASSLRLISGAPSGNNVVVSWKSVLGVGYSVQRAKDLGSPGTFTVVATNLAGQAGTTTFTDTNAEGAARAFYRVGVQ